MAIRFPNPNFLREGLLRISSKICLAVLLDKTIVDSVDIAISVLILNITMALS